MWPTVNPGKYCTGRARRRDRRGFTFAEFMVTSVIFAFIAGGTYGLFLAGDASWRSNRNRIEFQEELRKGLDWLSSDLRQAGPSSVLDVPADGAWYTAIRFNTCAGVTAGSASWSASPIQYALTGTRLQRTAGFQTRVVSQGVTLFRVRRLAANPDVVEIEMTAGKSFNQDQAASLSMDFKVRMRNE